MDRFDTLGYKPDKKRLLAAFRGEGMDKVPLFEHFIDDRIVEKILGRKAGNTCAAVGDPYKCDERSSAHGDMIIPMYPQDFIQVCKSICQDSTMVVACYTPFRKINKDGIAELITDGSVKSRKDWQKVILPSDEDVADRMGYLKAYREALKDTDLAITLQVGNMFVPFYRSLSGNDFFRLVYDDPVLIEEILDAEVDYFYKIVREGIKIGFDVMMSGDDLAHKHGMMINPDLLKKWYIPRAEKFYEPALNAGKPIIFDCDGNPEKIMDMIIGLGCSALFPIDANGLDFRQVKKKYGENICLYGGIDTDIIIRGTAEDTERYVKEVVLALKENGRFIAGTISDVNQMPFENFVTMINTIHRYGVY